MAEAFETPGTVCQNLKDSGCDGQTTEKCMSFVKLGKLEGMLPILKQYRKVLLG